MMSLKPKRNSIYLREELIDNNYDQVGGGATIRRNTRGDETDTPAVRHTTGEPCQEEGRQGQR